ncbi:hypothetical protein D0T53_00980 [Dysgonomonas sp. 216]|uniref:hypothetical protein n=1 Tax=Dysgonomonas sp. 216 TaxID=2302934 RepID=UPI0013D2E91E|nr:hypothetical protein [Dysgonomonas sp. 216]NDW17486.1 hypothetical protein [Dysgonomonas sp. 216]
MKLRKLLPLVLGVVTLGFASCSDDDDDSVSYKETKIVNFKMYVGSENGGVEVNTANIDPKKYFKEDLEEEIDDNEGVSITFSGNKATVSYSGEKGTISYKVENGKLYFGEENYWWFAGFGGTGGFKVSEHYGYYRTQYSYNFNDIDLEDLNDQETIDINDVMESNYYLGSLDDMRSIQDTIVFCTIESYFR